MTDVTTTRAWLSNTQIGLAFDCARAWQGVYPISVKPIERTSYPMRIGKLGHLYNQHVLDPRHDSDWAKRVAQLQAVEPFPYDYDEEVTATTAADRILERLRRDNRVPARDGEGPLVERLVRVPWATLLQSLRFNIPNRVWRAFAGMEGRIDLVDADGRARFLGDIGPVPVKIRDFKFTQKGVATAPPSEGVDRQLAVYRVLVQSIGFDVEEMVLTVVDARPMLTLADYLAEGSALVRADGLPSIVARNVERQVYLDAWLELSARRPFVKPTTDKARAALAKRVAEEAEERDRHAADLEHIERVVDRSTVMSWGVAREVVIDALHMMDSRLADAERGIFPANHRSHPASPCNTWCDMRSACRAATGFGGYGLGPHITGVEYVSPFEAACRDHVDRGEYESREQRHARIAAAEAALLASTPETTP